MQDAKLRIDILRLQNLIKDYDALRREADQELAEVKYLYSQTPSADPDVTERVKKDIHQFQMVSQYYSKKILETEEELERIKSL